MIEAIENHDFEEAVRIVKEDKGVVVAAPLSSLIWAYDTVKAKSFKESLWKSKLKWLLVKEGAMSSSQTCGFCDYYHCMNCILDNTCRVLLKANISNEIKSQIALAILEDIEKERCDKNG